MEVLIYIEWGPIFWKLCIIQFMTKNLQTKLYLALFLDFKYLVPLQSNEIFFRVSSEKTYCISLTTKSADDSFLNF